MDFKEQNNTITGEYYGSLVYKLKDATKEKQRKALKRSKVIPQ
jgi:hypothetical protein